MKTDKELDDSVQEDSKLYTARTVDGAIYDPETGVVDTSNSNPVIKETASLAKPISELQIRRKAKLAIRSGYLPPNIFTEEQVFVIVKAGEELGIPFMSSLRCISLVEGKITLESSLMRALVFRRIPGSRIDFVEASSEKCIVEMQRPGGKVNRFVFTIEDAKKAGLAQKKNWQRFPISMLISRVSAIGCRAVFPDALLGGNVFDPEELEGSSVASDYDIEIENLKQSISAIVRDLPEEKRTICIDQMNEAVSRGNISMLKKILSRTKEIIEEFKINAVNSESKEAVEEYVETEEV